jgi:hypothetical protein
MALALAIQLIPSCRESSEDCRSACVALDRCDMLPAVLGSNVDQCEERCTLSETDEAMDFRACVVRAAPTENDWLEASSAGQGGEEPTKSCAAVSACFAEEPTLPPEGTLTLNVQVGAPGAPADTTCGGLGPTAVSARWVSTTSTNTSVAEPLQCEGATVDFKPQVLPVGVYQPRIKLLLAPGAGVTCRSMLGPKVVAAAGQTTPGKLSLSPTTMKCAEMECVGAGCEAPQACVDVTCEPGTDCVDLGCETNCTNGVDDDQDGYVDCDDEVCKADPACTGLGGASGQ